MRCPKCGEHLEHRHTFNAGTDAQTQRRECVRCNIMYTLAYVIVVADPAYGEGAERLAKCLEPRVSEVQQTMRALLMSKVRRPRTGTGSQSEVSSSGG